MRIRLLTTLLLWAIIGCALGFGGIEGGKVLLLILAAMSSWEMATLLRKSGMAVIPATAMLATSVALAGHIWGFPSLGTSIALIIVLGSHFNAPIATMPAALLAAIVPAVGLGALHAIYLLDDPYSLIWVVSVFAIIKFADGGAYLIGRYLGKTKMAPALSPNKTWEGFVGGIIGGVVIGSYASIVFVPFWVGPLLGIILAITGSVGDMLESALKRAAKVKDSGHILPGLGGALDLTDSILLSAPIAWLILKAFSA